MKLRLRFDRFDAALVLAVVACYAGVSLLPFAPKKFGDLDFHVEAKTLAAAVRGAASWDQVALVRAPAPVVYYAIPYLAVRPGSSDGAYWVAGFLWTAAWLAVALLLIRRAAQHLGGPGAGKLAAILTVLAPFWAYYSFGINGEGPAFLGVAWFLWGWARWRNSGCGASPFSGSAAAVWMPLSFFLLIKPSALLLVPLALGAGLVLWLRNGPGERRIARFTFGNVAMTCAVLALSSALVRQVESRRHTAPQVQYLRWTVFFGSFQFRTEPWDWRFWDDSTRQGSADYALFQQEFAALQDRERKERVPISELEWKWTLRDAREHPGLRLRMAATRALAMHVNVVNSRRPEQFRLGPLAGPPAYWLFHLAVNGVLLLLLAGSIRFLAVRPAVILEDWPLWTPWAALLLFHSAIYAEPRFLFPSQPGLLVMAAVALRPALARLRSAPQLAPV